MMANSRINSHYKGMAKIFKEGLDAALLAPTALNQQKFKIGSFSVYERGCSYNHENGI